jgi:hypothetical protein
MDRLTVVDNPYISRSRRRWQQTRGRSSIQVGMANTGTIVRFGMSWVRRTITSSRWSLSSCVVLVGQ